MALKPRTIVPVPPGQAGGFDHADVDLETGRVFVAHTAFDCVEVVDVVTKRHVATVPNCSEASGVVFAPEIGVMLAAARGTGQVLVLGLPDGNLLKAYSVGARPNGCAWNPDRQQFLVADVHENRVRILDYDSGAVEMEKELPGRPRWAAYEAGRKRYLVNISDPARVAILNDSGDLSATWPVSSAGPHGLQLDPARQEAYVACDAGELVTVDLESGRERHKLAIGGPPDVLWLNEAQSLLYIAIGNPGIVQVVDTPSRTIVEEVVTEPGAHTLSFDNRRQLLHVFLPQSCAVAVYEQQAFPGPRL